MFEGGGVVFTFMYTCNLTIHIQGHIFGFWWRRIYSDVGDFMRLRFGDGVQGRVEVGRREHPVEWTTVLLYLFLCLLLLVS